MKTLRSKSDSDLFDLIIDECERFSKMSFEDRKRISKPPDWDLMYELPNRCGTMLTCGKQASDAIAVLVERMLSSNELLTRRCSFNVAYQTYKKYFLRCVEDETVNNLIDQEQFIYRYSNLIARFIRFKLKSYTFGVPCFLPIDSDGKNIFVGRIKFEPIHVFIECYSSRYPQAKPLDEVFKNELRQYPWLAFVTIKRTEPERGEIIAEDAVEAAINMVRLLLASVDDFFDMHRLGTTGGRVLSGSRCGFRFGGGTPHHWFSRLSHPYAGEDFADFVRYHHSVIELLSGALSYSLDGSEPTNFGIRFLDALKWFGEAALEGISGAQVVKSVMSMERIVIFRNDNDDGLGERVTKRVAALVTTYLNIEDTYISLKSEIRHYYKIRSDLMHGAIGPKDVVDNPYRSLEIAAMALLSFVAFLQNKSNRSDQKIRDAMRHLVSVCGN